MHYIFIRVFYLSFKVFRNPRPFSILTPIINKEKFNNNKYSYLDIKVHYKKGLKLKIIFFFYIKRYTGIFFVIFVTYISNIGFYV